MEYGPGPIFACLTVICNVGNKEGTHQGLAQLRLRSPGRSRAMIVTLWFEESTYAVARPVIPAPIMPIGSPMTRKRKKAGMWVLELVDLGC